MSEEGVLNVKLVLDNQEFNKNLSTALKNLNNFKNSTKSIGDSLKTATSDMGGFSEKTNVAFGNLNKLNNKLKDSNNAFGKAGKEIDGASTKLERFKNSISSISASLGGALASVGFGIMTKSSVDMASDMTESLNKVKVAFKDSSIDIEAFAKTTLDTYGIAESSALDMASLYGDMATSMGLPADKASVLSKQLVGLAGDLASFKNIGIDQATTALNGIFTGETESLKALGVVMTDANVQQYAYTKGIHEKISAMGQEEKVMLRAQYVFSQTANAQGDFARTSDGYANQSRMLKENLKELGATLGEYILPAFNKITKALNSLVTMLKEAPGPVKAFTAGLLVIGTISVPIIAIGVAIATLIVNIKLATLATAKNTAGNVTNATSYGIMATAISAIGLKLKGLASIQTFSQLASVVNVGVVGAFAKLATTIKTVGLALSTFLVGPVGLVLIALSAVILLGKTFYDEYSKHQKMEEKENELLEIQKKLREDNYSTEDLEGYKAEKEKLLSVMQKINDEEAKISENNVNNDAFKNVVTGEKIDRNSSVGLAIDLFINNKSYDEIDKLKKELLEMGYTAEQATEYIEMLTKEEAEMAKKVEETARALEVQEKALKGVTSAEMDALNANINNYKELESSTQIILDQIDAYEALSSIKNRTATENAELAKAMDYLSAVVGKNNVQLDSNGQLVGFNANALGNLKKQIIDTKNQANQGIKIQVTTNIEQVTQALANAQAQLSQLQNKKVVTGLQDAQYNRFGYGYQSDKTNNNVFTENLNKQIQEQKDMIAEEQRIYAQLTKELASTTGTSYKTSTASGSSGGSSGASKVTETAEEKNQEEIKRALDIYNYKKNMEELTIQEEIAMLKQIRDKTAINTQERMNLEEMLYTKRKEFSLKTVNIEIDTLEHRKAMGEITDQQYYEGLKATRERYTSWYGKNLDEQWKMDEKLYTLRKELENERVETFKQNLENAYDTEKTMLQKRKEMNDETYDSDIKRIEDESDVKVKVFKDQIDAMNRIAEKEDRDKQVANAKRLLKQYENSMTEAGQARAEELRRIIRDEGNVEIKSQLDLQIDAETDKADAEIAKRKRQYDSDVKLLEQQVESLDAIYKNMQEKTKSFADALIPLYNTNMEQLQKILQNNSNKELELKVSTTDTIFTALKNATLKGVSSVLSTINSLNNIGSNTNLKNINTNMNPQLATASAGTNNYNNPVSIIVQNMQIREESDITKTAQALTNLLTSKRRY